MEEGSVLNGEWGCGEVWWDGGGVRTEQGTGVWGGGEVGCLPQGTC